MTPGLIGTSKYPVPYESAPDYHQDLINRLLWYGTVNPGDNIYDCKDSRRGCRIKDLPEEQRYLEKFPRFANHPF